jgi:hypothetical protein
MVTLGFFASADVGGIRGLLLAGVKGSYRCAIATYGCESLMVLPYQAALGRSYHYVIANCVCESRELSRSHYETRGLISLE